MKLYYSALLLACVLSFCEIHATTRAGFYLPDTLQEITLPVRTVNDLLVLSVVINDTVHADLVLDTGCRNLVLFDKGFQKYFATEPKRVVRFAGLGDGKPRDGSLSLNNKVSINEIVGEKIPIVIVSKPDLFRKKDHVDGIIGYDIFIRFEIEFNTSHHQLKFRPAMRAHAPLGYAQIPVRIEDARPLLSSHIFFENDASRPLDVMIDTGSSLGLLLKTTDLGQYETDIPGVIIGKGLNGFLKGSKRLARKVLFKGFELKNISTDIIESPWHNYASIGMRTLKDYSVIINYCQAYVCLKKNS